MNHLRARLSGSHGSSQAGECYMARTPPWKTANPRKKAGKGSQRLSPARKAAAKRSAKKAGRRYPNLVDNIRAASKKKTVHKKKTRKR